MDSRDEPKESSEDKGKCIKEARQISEWDVSEVTDFRAVFKRTDFNADIGEWDVAKGTTMEEMFHAAYAFNHDLSKWDVSKVTNMHLMFGHAKAFNQDLSKWDVSNVMNMTYMFYNATAFEQVLCGPAWVNSKANKDSMFLKSRGEISATCGKQ